MGLKVSFFPSRDLDGPVYNISKKKKDDVSGALFTLIIHDEYTQTNTSRKIVQEIFYSINHEFQEPFLTIPLSLENGSGLGTNILEISKNIFTVPYYRYLNSL